MSAVGVDSDRKFCWFASAQALLDVHRSAHARIGLSLWERITGRDVMKPRVTWFVTLVAWQRRHLLLYNQSRHRRMLDILPDRR